MKQGVRAALGALCLALLLPACSGPMTLVAPTPPVKYQVIKRVEAEACGVILGPIFPFDFNGRVGEAQRLALAKAPGATALINVDIQENWTWALIAISRCTTISGDAIKEVM